MRTGNRVLSRSEHKIHNFNLVNAKVNLHIYNFEFSVSGGGDTVPPRVRGYPRAFPAMLCVKLSFGNSNKVSYINFNFSNLSF